MRSQIKSGKARVSRRTGKFEGSFIHPLRPRDWRIKCPAREIWKALKSMLSAKFAANEIFVVDDFNVQSHKVRYVAANLRNIVGYCLNISFSFFRLFNLNNLRT